MVKALLWLHNSSLNSNILWNMLFNFDKVHTQLKNEAWTQIVMCIAQAQKIVSDKSISSLSPIQNECVLL